MTTFLSNLIYECDALTILERLPSKSVALVYLNPPWNTHADFPLYPAVTDDRSNARYVSYLSTVVQQAHRVMTDEGSLFLHWSPKSTLDVRLLVNQLFAGQPRYEITYSRKLPGPGRRNGPPLDSEFLLVYSDAETPLYNPIFRPLSLEERTRYPKTDGERPYRLAELTAPFDRPQAQFTWLGHKPPRKRSWRFSREKLDALVEDNRIVFSATAGFPRLKFYVDDTPGIEIGTTWDDIPRIDQRERSLQLSIRAPLMLMERIVQIASNPGDWVLDPFGGCGTTLIAAQSLGRRWLGADDVAESYQVAIHRLQKSFGLVAGKDYLVASQLDIAKQPVFDMPYRAVVTTVAEIDTLQENLTAMTYYLLALKRLMMITDDNDERLESAVKQMEHWITASISSQPKSLDSYIAVVCSWLTGWDRLDAASQKFLPQAELLFESIGRIDEQDFSPFIIQYCRALENELLTKLFVPYGIDLGVRHQDIAAFLVNDLGNPKTEKFAKALKTRDFAYTLGDMGFIMNLMKSGGKTLPKSRLLLDFRDFTVRQFGASIIGAAFLDQIARINTDYRRKAAHPNVLDSQIAQRCRDHVRACLNELIVNYRGDSVRGFSPHATLSSP